MLLLDEVQLELIALIALLFDIKEIKPPRTHPQAVLHFQSNQVFFWNAGNYIDHGNYLKEMS